MEVHKDTCSAQGAAAAANAASTGVDTASSHGDDVAAAVPANSASNPTFAHLEDKSQQQISGPAAAIFKLLSSAKHSADQQQQQQQQQPQPDSAEVLLLKQALAKAAEEHQVQTVVLLTAVIRMGACR
jgi:ribonuclease D